MEIFKDTSIFQGVIQFHGPDGNEYRAMDQGSGVWQIYKYNNGAFVFSFSTKVRGKCSPEKLWNKIERLTETRMED